MVCKCRSIGCCISIAQSIVTRVCEQCFRGAFALLRNTLRTHCNNERCERDATYEQTFATLLFNIYRFQNICTFHWKRFVLNLVVPHVVALWIVAQLKINRLDVGESPFGECDTWLIVSVALSKKRYVEWIDQGLAFYRTRACVFHCGTNPRLMDRAGSSRVGSGLADPERVPVPDRVERNRPRHALISFRGEKHPPVHP